MGFRKKQTKTKTNQQPITSSDPFPAPTKKNSPKKQFLQPKGRYVCIYRP